MKVHYFVALTFLFGIDPAWSQNTWTNKDDRGAFCAQRGYMAEKLAKDRDSGIPLDTELRNQLPILDRRADSSEKPGDVRFLNTEIIKSIWAHPESTPADEYSTTVKGCLAQVD
jgi:hypothetical protein